MADGPSTGPDYSSPNLDINTPLSPHDTTMGLLGEADDIIAQSIPRPKIRKEIIGRYNIVTADYTRGYSSVQAEFSARIAALKEEIPQENKEENDKEITLKRIQGMQEMMKILFSNHSGSKEEFSGNLMMIGMQKEFEGVDFTGYFFEEPYSSEIFTFISSNPDYLEAYVKNDLSFVRGCAKGEVGNKTILLQSNIREKYLESQESIVRENLRNYFLNNGVSLKKVRELENEGKINDLLTTLRDGNCNIDNISKIHDFNNIHDLNISFTSDDARNILGSTINLLKTENDITIMRLRDELSQITGKSNEEIQAIFNIEDSEKRNTKLNLLLGQIEDITEKENIQARMQEIFELSEDISKQKERSHAIIDDAVKLFNMTPEDRDNYKKELLKNFESTPQAIKFIEGLDEFSWTQENIEYIREKPKERISEIQTTESLLKYFTKYPSDFETHDIRISDLYPSLTFSSDIIINFPGEINSEDLSHIPYKIFENKPDLIKQLLEKNDDINIITFFSQNPETLGDLHSALISMINGNSDFNIGGYMNIILYKYDKEHNKVIYTQMTKEERKVFESSENSKTLLEDKIEKEGIQKCMEEINIYLQVHPQGSLNINGEDFKTTENCYIYLIENGHFGGLTSLHWNRNISDNIVKSIIISDTGSIRYLAKNHLGKMENITLIVEKISNNGEPFLDELQFLPYINIMDESGTINTKKAIDVAVLINEKLGKSIQKIGGNINSNILNMIAGILKDLSSEDKQYILSSKKRADMFMILTGILKYKEEAKKIKIEALKVSSTGGKLEHTMHFLNGTDISQEGKIDLLAELTKKTEISQEVMNILITEFGGNTDKLTIFITKLKENLEIDLQDTLDEIQGTSISHKNIPPSLSFFFKKDPKNLNSESFINGENLLTRFENFIQNLSEKQKTELTFKQKKDLFLEDLFIGIDDNNEAKQIILRWLDTHEELVILKHSDVEVIIEEGKRGTLDNYTTKLRNQYYNGEISIASFENGSIPSKSQNIQESTTPSSYEIGGTDESPILITKTKSIPLTLSDAALLKNNPEAQENFINTYEAFDKSGLLGLWNIKDFIFKSISNVKGGAFSINGDFINKNELKILFNSILISINEKPLQEGTLSTIGIISEMERRNGTNADGTETEVNSYGESKIEAEFLQIYFQKGAIVFEHKQFENSLRN